MAEKSNCCLIWLSNNSFLSKLRYEKASGNVSGDSVLKRSRIACNERLAMNLCFVFAIHINLSEALQKMSVNTDQSLIEWMIKLFDSLVASQTLTVDIDTDANETIISLVTSICIRSHFWLNLCLLTICLEISICICSI